MLGGVAVLLGGGVGVVWGAVGGGEGPVGLWARWCGPALSPTAVSVSATQVCLCLLAL